MVNTPTLARGLAGLVSNKELLHNTWKEICHVVGKANWLSCWRANCNSPLHVWHNAGIRYLLVTFFTFHFSLFTTYPSLFAWLHSSFFTLHSSLFTLHSSPHTQAHSLGYILHSSFFTLFTIVAVLRGESCGEAGDTLPSPWEHRGHRHEGWFPPWGSPWGRGQKSESVSSNPRACVLTAALRTRQKKYALSCSVIDGRDRSG